MFGRHKIFFKFLIKISRFSGKLEKNSSSKRLYRNYNESTEIVLATSRDEKTRRELCKSNVDWLFCKYCKLRIYLASRALSLKSMVTASRLLGRGTPARIDLSYYMQLQNAADFKILFFFRFPFCRRTQSTLDASIRNDKAMTKPDFHAKSHAISECVRLRAK